MIHAALSFPGLLYYRARCTCGWEGPRRWRRKHADADANVHTTERSRTP